MKNGEGRLHFNLLLPLCSVADAASAGFSTGWKKDLTSPLAKRQLGQKERGGFLSPNLIRQYVKVKNSSNFIFSFTKLQLKKEQATKQEDTVSTFVCSPDIALGKTELQKPPAGPQMFSEVRGGYPVIKGEKSVNERLQLASKNMVGDRQIPHTQRPHRKTESLII